MNASTAPFVDPTIPGLSGRDLVEKASHAIVTGRDGASSWRWSHAIRRGLAGMDMHQLRDLGLNRDAA